VVDEDVPPPIGRLLLGGGVFVLGWVLTLVTVARTSLPPSVAGVVVFVGPKLGVLAAIAVLGKPGFRYLKRLVLGYLKPPKQVSPPRHRLGIVMFVSAIVLSSIEPYMGILTPRDAARTVRFTLIADLLLLTSVLVLGGDFWDKIRALFFRDAKATFPRRESHS
jgi:hypothetical protein